MIPKTSVRDPHNLKLSLAVRLSINISPFHLNRSSRSTASRNKPVLQVI